MDLLHANLKDRVAVATDALPWISRDGLQDKLLEVAADRRTALLAIPPGGQLPAFGEGGIDVLVLGGELASHPAGTYVRDSASTRLATATGCTVLVKDRHGPVPARVVVDTAHVALPPPDGQGMAMVTLHEDDRGKVALLQFAPGASLARHGHDFGEEFFVLHGELRDDHGSYGPGWWVRQPAGSAHAVQSAGGCRTLVFADHLAPRPRRFEVGDVIEGRYRIDALLARGNRADLFTATGRDRRLTIEVMIAGVHHPLVRYAFVQAARLQTRVVSPHVVAPFDLGTCATGQHYIVTELVETRLRGPLEPNTAVKYAIQACAALAAVHAAGLVHRDVKPANLWLTTGEDGRPLVKLGSFGIAIEVPLPVAGPPVPRAGTPVYMSPEQVTGARTIDGRSDLWSLGVTLYELVTGTWPFRGRTVDEVTRAILGAPPPPIAGISPALAAVIARCLAKDPAQRFATATELADALRGCLGN